MSERGVDDAGLAATVARNLECAAQNPDGLRRPAASAAELRKTPWAAEPLRKGYLAPVGDSAVCLILAAEGAAEKARTKPVWIHGMDQREEMQALGARDLARSRSAELAARRALDMAGLASARDVDLVELGATTPVEERILREALGLDAEAEAGPVVNPSGGAWSGHPALQTGLIRVGEAFRQLSGAAKGRVVSGARRAIAHAAQGHCLQQNLVVVLGAERRGP
jgi:acetyl-CoA acetyltransferase